MWDESGGLYQWGFYITLRSAILQPHGEWRRSTVFNVVDYYVSHHQRSRIYSQSSRSASRFETSKRYLLNSQGWFFQYFFPSMTMHRRLRILVWRSKELHDFNILCGTPVVLKDIVPLNYFENSHLLQKQATFRPWDVFSMNWHARRNVFFLILKSMTMRMLNRCHQCVVL